jgi:hypothetical protein
LAEARCAPNAKERSGGDLGASTARRGGGRQGDGNGTPYESRCERRRRAGKEVIMRSIAFSSALLLGLLGGSVGATEPVEGESRGIDHAVPAVSQAFEIGVAGGYLQGAGDIGTGMGRVQDYAGAGGGGELKLGYRPIASLAFGIFGGCSAHGTGDLVTAEATSTTASAGLFADWHFRPDRSVDPWVGLSTGWRGLWIVPNEGDTTSWQGLEIARLQLGLDYRITPEIAIAPVLGASMSMFLAHETPDTSGFDSIGSPKPNFFFFGGLQARFDLFGTRAPASRIVASSR